MNARTRMKAGVAGLAATLALVALGPAAAVAGSKTTLTISAYGYFGKVKSPNKSCVAGRKVVLKQKGHGVLGRSTSGDNGSWNVDPSTLKFKGQLPFRLFAVAKPSSKCAGATSKTIVIKGG
jgi:hypothetical protein